MHSIATNYIEIFMCINAISDETPKHLLLVSAFTWICMPLFIAKRNAFNNLITDIFRYSFASIAHALVRLVGMKLISGWCQRDKVYFAVCTQGKEQATEELAILNTRERDYFQIVRFYFKLPTRTKMEKG